MFRNAFTLVEILVVVVILGILGAIVVPQFAKASEQAQEVATLEQLTRVRRALSVYYVRANATYPAVSPGDGTWGELLSAGYLRPGAPANGWVSGSNSRLIQFGSSPDTAWHQNYGWIYNPLTADVWAAGFDALDKGIARP
jgi:prepilin-type N-terminal cleavage/methylation domain-containing protein